MVTTRNGKQLSTLEQVEILEKFGHSERARKRLHKLIDSNDEEEPMRWSSRPSNRFSMFIVFNKQHRQRISRENPELSNQEISAKVSQDYRDLTPEAKEKLRQQCAQLRNESRQKDKPPTLPLSGYFMFNKDKRPGFKELYPKASVIELNQMVANLWKASDPKVRQKYNERSRKAREKFKAEQQMNKLKERRRECGEQLTGSDCDSNGYT